MHFSSDNWAGCHPAIAENLNRHAGGFSAGYGNGELDLKVTDRLREIFECDLDVFFVSTGTAANSLSLASFQRPGGVIFAYNEAHVIVDECGAPHFLSGSMRLSPISGKNGKMDIKMLADSVSALANASVHQGRPAGITITQSSETGTVYSLYELDAIAAIARSHNLPLHMDGARFANALVALDVSPAEMTWKRGVDLLSFGATKNGCWCAEAIVVFDRSHTEELRWLQKRSAQLFSKTRFIAAQFDAYLANDLWLKNARHANAMGQALARAIEAAPGMRLTVQPQANEIFAVLENSLAQRLRNAGAFFYDWETPPELKGNVSTDETVCRFVTSFATTQDDIDRFAAVIGAEAIAAQ
ncbi:threonine aldolase family protein [Limoniibacter endophyticus]|uniref:L-threonine aldolase n=1 Tax=Limoniibacter endophyticus TaxID=1565040 RepID=A0A8J3DGC8_9HYPH|nr:low specificity L-threonine aldolase [Limoniibacter endophyticus]GHC64215.1 L-threonine aldolase [Limoniibacter endophyticus]